MGFNQKWSWEGNSLCQTVERALKQAARREAVGAERRVQRGAGAGGAADGRAGAAERGDAAGAGRLEPGAGRGRGRVPPDGRHRALGRQAALQAGAPRRHRPPPLRPGAPLLLRHRALHRQEAPLHLTSTTMRPMALCSLCLAPVKNIQKHRFAVKELAHCSAWNK